jgi:hypothetical protein
MKIKIYAPDQRKADELAASMNLALRHWEYAGPWRLIDDQGDPIAVWLLVDKPGSPRKDPIASGPAVAWADVGAVLDYHHDLFISNNVPGEFPEPAEPKRTLPTLLPSSRQPSGKPDPDDPKVPRKTPPRR